MIDDKLEEKEEFFPTNLGSTIRENHVNVL